MVFRVFLALLFSILFLATPAQVFAAFTIEQISPTEITSVDQELTLFISASNLSSQTHYFQVAMTKEGASNYFGQTQGSSGVWTKYASSPDFASLVAITPTDGVWHGELKAKLDTTDSGFSGAGTYQVKLLKYITSGGTSSNSVPITVALTNSVSSQTPTPASAQTSDAPKIQFSLPTTQKVGEDFTVPISLLNFDPGNYYAKVRIGKDTSHLTLGQTFNSDWLSDTDSWTKFPSFSTSSSLKVRLSGSADPGTYVVRVRLKKIDTDTTFDSEDKTLSFGEGIKPTVTAKTTPIKSSPTPTKTPTQSTAKTGSVLAVTTKASTLAAEINQNLKAKDLLATHTSALASNSSTKKSLRLRLQDQLDDNGLLIGGLTMLGFLLFSVGVGWFLKKKYF